MVVGFAGVALFPHEAQVMTVAVDPSLQGRSVGARLVAGALEEVAWAVRGAGIPEVRAGNVAALRMYRRGGFGVAGVRPAYDADGEGAVVMRRRRGVEVN